MTHRSDDELLDRALRRNETDVPDDAHLRGCPGCAARYARVLAEQDLFRRAFQSASPSEAPRPRTSWFAAAAALVIGALIGTLLPHGGDGRIAVASLDRCEDELRRIPDQVRDLREADAGRLEREYPAVLARAERLYSDFLELYLGGASPLNGEQREGVRSAVDSLYSRVWEGDAAAARDFRAGLRGVLSPAQYDAVDARLLRDLQQDRIAGIDIVAEELADALDLRQSEEAEVRRRLEAEFPRPEVPSLALAQWPPDRLSQDSVLAGAVRRALPTKYHPGFDAYVESLRRVRGILERVARSRVPHR
jgi:anti-sigma factor RsiW